VKEYFKEHQDVVKTKKKKKGKVKSIDLYEK
jgi:predicted RNA-binding protein